jgi:GNAT superfamily N-acetyltransferase
MPLLLTIAQVARAPGFVHYGLSTQKTGPILFRPLHNRDAAALGRFLAALGPETRRLWQRDGFDRAEARALCEAIGRYDKLRLVATPAKGPATILALFEFSFGLPPGDRKRYAGYGIDLDEGEDCRFGPCVLDELRGSGLAAALMPPTFDIARRFGRQRILLWGGVLVENIRAIRFYAKHGFRAMGRFTNQDGKSCLDMMLDLTDPQP